MVYATLWPIGFGSIKTLLRKIKDFTPAIPGQSLDKQQWKTLVSVLTGTVLYREKNNQDNQDKKTRSGVKKIIKEHLHIIWAYDEAQSLNTLNIPTAPELFGEDPKFKRMVSGFHDGGIRKSEIMFDAPRGKPAWIPHS